MIEQIIWGILFIVCLALGIWEISRWSDPDLASVITLPHKRRRAAGLVLLLAISCLGYKTSEYRHIHLLSKLAAAHLLLDYMTIMILVVGLVGVAYYEWKSTLVEFSESRKEVISESVSDLPVVDHGTGKSL